MRKAILSLLALSAATATTSFGTMDLYIYESGSDLVLSYSGSINMDALTGLDNAGTSLTMQGGMLRTDLANFSFGTPSAPTARYTTDMTGPTSIACSTISIFASTGTGPGFGVGGNNKTIVLPRAYTSDSLISGSATFYNQTLASYGFTTGNYAWTLKNGSNVDYVNLTVGGVPEPDEVGLGLGAGALLAACAVRGRGRKRA